MSSDVSPSQSPNQAPLPPSAPRRRSVARFFGRLVSALLVILITTALSLLAVGAGLLSLGYTARTPADASVARERVATLEAQQAGLEARAAELEARLGDQRETLDELQGEVAAMRELRGSLEDQLETSASQSATMVADARLSRDQVLAFATAEAGRAALLQDLERRGARIERFLDRLSDIAADTALDLDAGTPDALSPPATPSPADAVTLTSTALTGGGGAESLAPSPTPSATPTGGRATTGSPTPTP